MRQTALAWIVDHPEAAGADVDEAGSIVVDEHVVEALVDRKLAELALSGSRAPSRSRSAPP